MACRLAFLELDRVGQHEDFGEERVLGGWSRSPNDRLRSKTERPHWEGDLVVGQAGRAFIATLVERQTRYAMLAHLGADASTDHVIAALKQRIRELPAHPVLSLTWDQGKELSAHARFRAQTGIDVYSCDPHSLW